MSLTDEQLLKLWAPEPSRPVMGRNKILEFARAIESAATAPLLERIAELERELEALRKDAEWRPVETAPKDVTVLLYGAKRLEMCVGMNHSRDGWVTDTTSELASMYTPTHWMPLPPPPDAAKEQG